MRVKYNLKPVQHFSQLTLVLFAISALAFAPSSAVAVLFFCRPAAVPGGEGVPLSVLPPALALFPALALLMSSMPSGLLWMPELVELVVGELLL